MNLPWTQHKNITMKLQQHQVENLKDVEPGMTIE